MIKNKDQAFQLFLKDLEQPAFQFAIYRSFKRWATLRDQLIEEYVKVTGIPAEEFRSQIALKNASFLS
jgi:hypothetical protein